jgi:hypothetical protein
MTIPPSLRRGLIRGLAVAACNAAGLCGLALVWFGETASIGRWDLAFVALLGLVAAPLEPLEAWARERPRARRALIAVACGLLAALGLLMAHAQVSYAFALARGAALDDALGAPGRGLAGVVTGWGEARTILVAFAAPFGTVALLRGARLVTQLAVAVAVSSLCLALALRGFVGLPQVSWLVATPWLGSTVQSFLFLQPVLLSVLLPLASALAERATPPRPR